MNRRSALCLLIILTLVAGSSAVAQPEIPTPPVRYDADGLSTSFHQDRRTRVLDAMPDDAVAVFFSAPERRRSGDTQHAFRQDSDLYYLTGSIEPNTVLMLAPGGVNIEGQRHREVLFVPPRTQYSDVWLGRRYGAERAEAELGVERAISNETFEEVLSAVAADPERQFFHLPLPRGVESRSELADQVRVFERHARPLSASIDDNLERAVMFALRVEDGNQFARAQNMLSNRLDDLPPDGLASDVLKAFVGSTTFEEWDSWRQENVQGRFADGTALRSLLTELRISKEDEELELLQRAIDITAEAHQEVAMALRPGMYEYQAQALIEYIFMREGAEAPGFATIVGSGENSVILHYSTNRRQMEADDLVVIDIGAEYRGYTADVTRTLPVDGSFSEEQRAIYELVRAAQEAGIEAARAGNSFGAPGQAATMVIADGLMELGLIEQREDVRRFFMHGTSHYLGLDVHDVGDYGALRPRQVITIEPGIYVSPNDDIDPRWWNIGVRIEDDVLITDTDPVVLSAGAPKTIEEIESLMREESAIATAP